MDERESIDSTAPLESWVDVLHVGLIVEREVVDYGLMYRSINGPFDPRDHVDGEFAHRFEVQPEVDESEADFTVCLGAQVYIRAIRHLAASSFVARSMANFPRHVLDSLLNERDPRIVVGDGFATCAESLSNYSFVVHSQTRQRHVGDLGEVLAPWKERIENDIALRFETVMTCPTVDDFEGKSNCAEPSPKWQEFELPLVRTC